MTRQPARRTDATPPPARPDSTPAPPPARARGIGAFRTASPDPELARGAVAR